MSSHSIRLGAMLGATVTEDGSVTFLANDGDVLGTASAADMERFIQSYGDWRLRVAPLRESDTAFMIQHLAGNGLLALRAMVHNASGYVLHVHMKRWPNVRWKVHNYADWYRAQEAAELEALQRS